MKNYKKLAEWLLLEVKYWHHKYNEKCEIQKGYIPYAIDEEELAKKTRFTIDTLMDINEDMKYYLLRVLNRDLIPGYLEELNKFVEEKE